MPPSACFGSAAEPSHRKPGGVRAGKALFLRVCGRLSGVRRYDPNPLTWRAAAARSAERHPERATNVVKLTLRDKETAQEAVRRFRKLVERSGIKKEMRIREFYEKPSATKRRAKIRAQRRARRERTAPR